MEDRVSASGGAVRGPAYLLTLSKVKGAGGGDMEGPVKTGNAVGRRGGCALSSEDAVSGTFTEDRVLVRGGAVCGPACFSTTSKKKVAGGAAEGRVRIGMVIRRQGGREFVERRSSRRFFYGGGCFGEWRSSPRSGLLIDQA